MFDSLHNNQKRFVVLRDPLELASKKMESVKPTIILNQQLQTREKQRQTITVEFLQHWNIPGQYQSHPNFHHMMYP